MTEKDYRSRPTGLSKEEIAKQFQLPERKSKIATLLKQDGQAYCLCRSSDSSRFMIGCDSCEEWYHGDCIGITQKEAKFIKQYYCPRCKEEDPTLETKFKPGGKLDSDRDRVQSSDKDKSKKKKEPRSSDHSTDKKSKSACGQCINCGRHEDCGTCQACKDAKRFGSSRQREKCFKRQCLKVAKGNVMGRRGRKTTAGVATESKKTQSDSDVEYVHSTKVIGPMQCYGPNCTRQNRPNSKYCSNECGRLLATNRIYQVLPQRIQEWAVTPSIAETMNRQQLDTIRKQQWEVKNILQELDKRHLELDAILERAKNALIEENEEETEEEGEMSMYCITCGHEIHSRTAIKHMEKCFNKYESQASFGSIYKTRIEGNNMFCDFYNPANRTYCKRLRVLCPEHCKDPKVSNTEVCGCPLVTNVFDLTGEFCRQAKKSCLKHYCWEKLRRAEVDMERVRQWMKLDELVEQERQIRQRMSDRAGVLALMLHSTYDHEIMEQVNTTSQSSSELEEQLSVAT
ncbi:CXXC-type zinc finger protein 1-like [Macrosteles quadrilineatus]|uniref:CXXC-type zinc finger protein 1-like n=1 Tax=Macrosteles quadrilineatus TaxID=74068 RepID=UPI0023E155E2|nr:CXXC-type zinc finger protein 1-like [Macrosteles quadrilineatus]